jgi:hypothetical protein
MRGNWSRQPYPLRKATWDKTYSLHSYSRLLEALVNAVAALKPAWNLVLWDREGCGYRKIWPVEGGRLVDLGRRSGRNLDPTIKIDSLNGRSAECKLLILDSSHGHNGGGVRSKGETIGIAKPGPDSPGQEASIQTNWSPQPRMQRFLSMKPSPKNPLYRILPGFTGQNLGALWEHFPARKGGKWGCMG